MGPKSADERSDHDLFRTMRVGKDCCLALLLAFGNSGAATADGMACNALKGVKRPTAVLVGPTGTLSKGPVDFGTYQYRYDPGRFELEIKTDYKLITAPGRFEARAMVPMGEYAAFRQTKDLCPASRTYEISVRSPEAKSASELDQFQRPWRYDLPIELAEVEFPSSQTGYVAFEMKFDARVVGTIVRSLPAPDGRRK